jgi:hypothetical protein
MFHFFRVGNQAARNQLPIAICHSCPVWVISVSRSNFARSQLRNGCKHYSKAADQMLWAMGSQMDVASYS